jgi:chorismate mutase
MIPAREEQAIAQAQEFAKGGPLPPEAIGRVYQKLIEEMRNWEAKLDVAAPNP